MGRRHRAIELTPWHHVTNRGARRQVIFHDDDQRLLFGGLIDEAHDRFGVGVIAYCLMDNHFHLVLDCPEGGMSEFMHRIGSGFARHVNDQLGTDGPLFRGRFQSRPIMSDQYLHNAVRYVHRNPLDIAGVTAVESYRWSSHRTYLGLRSTPRWLRPDIVLDRFADVAAFHQSVSGDAAPLGDRVLDVRVLMAAIEHVIDEAALSRAVQGAIRIVAILLLDVLPPEPAGRLEAELGFASDDARERARRRARAKAGAHPVWAVLAGRAVELATGCAVSDLSVVPPVTFDTAQPVRDPYGGLA
jgi:REP element-mobilizing transposase RayT